MIFSDFLGKLAQDEKMLKRLLAIVDFFHPGTLLPGPSFCKTYDALKESPSVGAHDWPYQKWCTFLIEEIRRTASRDGASSPWLVPEDCTSADGDRRSIYDRTPSPVNTPEEILQNKEDAQFNAVLSASIRGSIDSVIDRLEETLGEFAEDFRAIKHMEILGPQTGHEKCRFAKCVRAVNSELFEGTRRQRTYRWNDMFEEMWKPLAVNNVIRLLDSRGIGSRRLITVLRKRGLML